MKGLRIGGTLVSILLLLAGCDAAQQMRTVEAQASDCDAAQSRCQMQVDGLDIALTLEQGLQALKPFAVKAEINGSEAIGQVIMDFQMIGMEMAPNRYYLIAADGYWRGTSTLPVCATGRTQWLAVMEFTQAGKQYQLSFPFTTR